MFAAATAFFMEKKDPSCVTVMLGYLHTDIGIVFDLSFRYHYVLVLSIELILSLSTQISL